MSPDTRQHRGPHPADKQLFSNNHLPALREATADLSWLLSRGYSLKSSLKLVGDRHSLKERQRLAVSRAACSDSQLQHRRARCISIDNIRGEGLAIDGFNLLITIEAALSGGVLIVCSDGCMRDLSSVHGSYRSVVETERAIFLIGEALERFGAGAACWFLDKPISNSGRLAQLIRDLATNREWPWEVEVVFNPDSALAESSRIAVSSDSAILDRAARWVNLNSHLLQCVRESWIIDLRPPS